MVPSPTPPDTSRPDAATNGAGTAGVPDASGTAAWWQRLVARSRDVVALFGADLTIRYMSPAVEHVLGYTPEEMVGTCAFSFVEPGDAARLAPVHRKLLEEPGTHLSYSLRVRAKDGTLRWIDNTVTNLLEDPEIGALVVNWHDLTDWRDRELTLRQSEERLANLFDAVRDCVLLIDVDTGRVIEANTAAERLFGRLRRDLLGAHHESLYPADISPLLLARLRRELSHPTAEFTAPVLASNGRRLPVGITYHGFTLADGRPAVQAIFRDQTDRTVAERLLRDHRNLASALSRTSDELEAMVLCVETVRRTPGIDTAGFYIVEPATGDLVLAHVDGASPEFVAANGRFGADSPRVKWLMSVGTLHDRPSMVPLGAHEEPAMQQEGFVALSVVPLRHEGTVFGCLNVASRSLERMPPSTCDAIETVSAMACEAILRARAEARMRVSDERLRTLFDTMEQGVVYQERDGRISAFNPAACQILGLTPDQVTGRTSFDPEWRAVREDGTPFPGEDHPSMIALRTGESVRGVIMGVFSPLTRLQRWISIDAVPLAGPDGLPVRAYTVFTDITARIEAERALKEHETRYQSLVHASLDGFVVIDLEGRILEVNQTYCRMAGRTVEELLQLGVADVDASVPPAAVPSQITRIVRQGWARFESAHRRADGTTFEVEVSAWYVPGQNRVLNVVRDLSERRQSESALREHERRYQALLVGAMDGYLVLDREGRILEANEAISEMLRVPRQDLLKSRITDFDPTYGKDQGAPPIAQVFERGAMRFESILRRADGELLSTEVSAWTMPALDQVMGFVRDLTAARRAEASLRDRDEQLRQAQKMEAIGRLAGGVAHDFNNLLTVINASATMALDQLREDDPLRADLQEIHNAGARAANLTRQLLTFSRRQVVQPRVIDLNTVVTDLDRMLRRLIGEDVVVSMRLSDRPVRVTADPGQIEQVLVNLAVNARDAMPNGGSLVIETGHTEVHADAPLRPPELVPGPYTVLSVSDTGTGMDEELLKHIFEPFFTTKGANGTGLGLSTVYGIVKQADGHILVTSHVGAGTRMEILLPPTQVEPEEATHETARHGAISGGETVLLVEDDASVRQILRLILEATG